MSSTNAVQSHGNPSDPHDWAKHDGGHLEPQRSMDEQLNSSGLQINGLPPQFQYNASLHTQDPHIPQAQPGIAPPTEHGPLGAGLRLQTALPVKQTSEKANAHGSEFALGNWPQFGKDYTYNAGLPVRNSSVKSTVSSRRRRAASLSPGSGVSSPGVGPLADLTPLPSPLTWGSPEGIWNTMEYGQTASETSNPSDSATQLSEPWSYTRGSPKKQKIPLSLIPESKDASRLDTAQIYNINASNHARNRSLSEYVPDAIQVPRSRNIAVSGSGGPLMALTISPPGQHMHREEYLAVQRGLTTPISKPPTPPKSTKSSDQESIPSSPHSAKESTSLCYEARMVRQGQIRQWDAIRQLGKGTFSTVMLATSERVIVQDSNGALDGSSDTSTNEQSLDPKKLVAVKICEHGPAGGADEKKVELSLKRELEIMKSIDHPSLVHLKAVNILEQRAFLVLNYCAGGDLFEFACTKLELLTPKLIRRIFAELVAAVRCLHQQYIVHRDIKLENVLVNVGETTLATISDLQSYPYPLVTLTDLGLGRWIPMPPSSPLLDTRCGSEDYAAPEVLMGQEYDGRNTDAWALGVLLYALMEGRLPFDPIPGSRRKSPTTHRIARCEWSWYRWADEDGEWDPTKGEALGEARLVVEGLIARARNRWSLEKVEELEWVKQAITVDGGLRRPDDDSDEDV